MTIFPNFSSIYRYPPLFTLSEIGDFFIHVLKLFWKKDLVSVNNKYDLLFTLTNVENNN